MLQSNFFQNVVETLSPKMLPGELGIPEYPSIPFLPGFPEDKTLEQFPYTVENG
jgi:hypothetical protein